MKISVKLRQRDCGWLIVAAVVLGIDIAVKEGETLSEAYDDYLKHAPVLAYGVPILTLAHLWNLLPSEHDPFSRFFAFLRRWRWVRKASEQAATLTDKAA